MVETANQIGTRYFNDRLKVPNGYANSTCVGRDEGGLWHYKILIGWRTDETAFEEQAFECVIDTAEYEGAEKIFDLVGIPNLSYVLAREKLPILAPGRSLRGVNWMITIG